MNEKLYKGTNVQEILGRIRTELGPDAVIHSTRWTKPSGFFGIFGKELVEVVASDGAAATVLMEPPRQPCHGLVERRYREVVDCMTSKPMSLSQPNSQTAKEEPKRLLSRAGNTSTERGSDAAQLAMSLIRQGFPGVEARRFADAVVQGMSESDACSIGRLKSYLITLLRGMVRTQPGLEPG